MNRLAMLAVVAFASLAAPADAAPVTFFGEDLKPASGAAADIPNASAARAAFDAYFSGNVYVEDFEDYADGASLPEIPPRTLATATFKGPGPSFHANFVQAGSVDVGAGPLATSGNKVYNNDEDAIFVGYFDVPVHGFGFYGIDFVTGPATIYVEFTDGTSELFELNQTLDRNSIFFFGFADFSRTIRFVSGGTPLPPNEWGGENYYDDVVVGIAPTDVPEPATLGLFGLGLLGLATRRARR